MTKESVKQSTSRLLEGEVVSDKMQKTIVVAVQRTFVHPSFGKVISRSKKYKAHDEGGTAKIGDWVEIAECRPLSKTKHMILNRVIKAAAR